VRYHICERGEAQECHISSFVKWPPTIGKEGEKGLKAPAGDVLSLLAGEGGEGSEGKVVPIDLFDPNSQDGGGKVRD